MSSIKSLCKWKSRSRGQTMTEYVLVIVSISAVVIAFFQNAATILSALVHQVEPLL